MAQKLKWTLSKKQLNMKRLNLLFILFMATIFITSCDEIFEEVVYGNNVVSSVERPAGDFDEIITTGPFDIYLTQSVSRQLVIEAEENLLPFIQTSYRGDNLYIEVEDGYQLRNNAAIKIFTSTPVLHEIKLTGSGKVEMNSLETRWLDLKITGSGDITIHQLLADELDAEITGSGDIFLSGAVNNSELTITGSGDIRSLDLSQEDCESTISGSGNMYINVIHQLDAQITGTGNIYYLGSPLLTENITGTGRLIKY